MVTIYAQYCTGERNVYLRAQFTKLSNRD